MGGGGGAFLGIFSERCTGLPVQKIVRAGIQKRHYSRTWFSLRPSAFHGGHRAVAQGGGGVAGQGEGPTRKKVWESPPASFVSPSAPDQVGKCGGRLQPWPLYVHFLGIWFSCALGDCGFLIHTISRFPPCLPGAPPCKNPAGLWGPYTGRGFREKKF